MLRVGARTSPVCRPHRLTLAGCAAEVATPLLKHRRPCSTLGSPVHEGEEFTRVPHQRMIVKTGERKREMRLGFHPPSCHAVLSV
jgi:hypothetical protein